MSPSTNRKSQAGYTFAEILTVLVIIGVMIAIGFKKESTHKAKEYEYGQAAKADLEIIFNAQKTYKIERGAYLAATDAAQLNAGLGISIRNTRFSFVVQRPTPATFRAVATRRDGTLCRGRQMTITHNGEFTKDCALW